MPGQCRALDASRVCLDPGQGFEPLGLLSQRLGQFYELAAGNPGMELRKQSAGLFDRFAFEHLGHQ